jgi:hypothetical protein
MISRKTLTLERVRLPAGGDGSAEDHECRLAASCNTLMTLEITRRTSTIDPLMLRKVSSMSRTIFLNVEDDVLDVEDNLLNGEHIWWNMVESL